MIHGAARRRVVAKPSLELHLRTLPHFSVEGRSVALEWVDEGEADYLWRYAPARDVIQFNGGILHGKESSIKAVVREVADHAIIPRTRQLAARHHLAFSVIHIRDQRSRWGSCSARKAISLNWRLILLPPELHDYVIWHELAHLQHFNHSRKYWAFLETLDSASAEHDAALTRISPLIMPLGR